MRGTHGRHTLASWLDSSGQFLPAPHHGWPRPQLCHTLPSPLCAPGATRQSPHGLLFIAQAEQVLGLHPIPTSSTLHTAQEPRRWLPVSPGLPGLGQGWVFRSQVTTCREQFAACP